MFSLGLEDDGRVVFHPRDVHQKDGRPKVSRQKDAHRMDGHLRGADQMADLHGAVNGLARSEGLSRSEAPRRSGGRP
jgi:hypothetical protein